MKLELTGSLTDAHGTMNADELTTLVASRSPSPGTPSIVPASGDRDAVVDLIAVLAVGGCAVPVDPQSSAEDQAELATRLGLSSGYDMPDLTSTALVLSSSGSNGRPKLVRHSLDSTLVGVAVYRQRFGITPDDVVLLAVPWCHSFGLIAGLLTAVSSGARVVALPRITPPAVHEAMARENATVLLCTPLLVDLLVRTASTASYRGLRVAISSGSPCLPAVVTRSRAGSGAGSSRLTGRRRQACLRSKAISHARVTWVRWRTGSKHVVRLTVP